MFASNCLLLLLFFSFFQLSTNQRAIRLISVLWDVIYWSCWSKLKSFFFFLAGEYSPSLPISTDLGAFKECMKAKSALLLQQTDLFAPFISRLHIALADKKL